MYIISYILVYIYIFRKTKYIANGRVKNEIKTYSYSKRFDSLVFDQLLVVLIGDKGQSVVGSGVCVQPHPPR